MLSNGYLHVRGLCPCVSMPFPVFLSKIYLETEKVFLPNRPLMPQKSNALHDVIRICKAWHGLNSTDINKSFSSFSDKIQSSCESIKWSFSHSICFCLACATAEQFLFLVIDAPSVTKKNGKPYYKANFSTSNQNWRALVKFLLSSSLFVITIKLFRSLFCFWRVSQ